MAASDFVDTGSNDRAINRALTIYRNGIGEHPEFWSDENLVQSYVLTFQ